MGSGWILNINQLIFLQQSQIQQNSKRDDNNISFPAFYNGLRLDPMVS
jgi:hypothetical protein